VLDERLLAALDTELALLLAGALDEDKAAELVVAGVLVDPEPPPPQAVRALVTVMRNRALMLRMASPLLL
jgi:hypothetical protein